MRGYHMMVAQDEVKQDEDGAASTNAGMEEFWEYDREALRRALAHAFSAGELSRFAQRFKVFTDREGSLASAAAQLVRALDARNKLGDLNAALVREKPDVDWPQPTRRLVAVSAPPSPAPPSPGNDADADADPALLDPYVAAPAAAAPTTAAAAPPPPAPSPTPGAAAASAPPATALDGRRLTLIAGLVFAGGLALGIGATVYTVARQPTASDSQLAADTGPVALALLAADALGTSVTYVSEACEMDESFPTVRERLAESFRRCGLIDIPTREAAPRARARPTLSSAPRRTTRRPRERSIPLRQPSPGAMCLDKCHGVHEQCKKTECGPEPTSASDYAAYQQCSARCVSRYSRCRLSCR